MRLRGSIAFVGVAAILAAACAAIGGLGDYEEVDCPGCTSQAEASTPEGGGPVIEFATIGGNVAGLTGTGLILKDNGADDLQIGKDGPFEFPAKVRNGDPYLVTVSAQPSTPDQECTVERGAGTVKGANVTDVAVTCTNAKYSVGGTIIDLTGGTGLVLTNNGGDPLPVAADGTFTFPTKVPTGSMFAVAVKQQPTGGGPCRVSGGTGTVGQGNVTSVVVNCGLKYSISGTVTGLSGSLALKNNGGPDLNVNSSSFAFPTLVPDLLAYSVTVSRQPTYPPRNQTCTVMNGTGSIAGADVTNVRVTCATNSFTVGGTVGGLTGTLVLKRNGVETVMTNMNGNFTFPTAVPSGTAYSVTISTPSAGQSCIVSGGTGVVANGPVTSVSVACSPGIGDGIRCGASTCGAPSQVCCHAELGSTGSCQAGGPACPGGTSSLACDDELECGGAPNVCCESIDQMTNALKAGKCEPSAANCVSQGQTVRALICKMASPVCPAGQSCVNTGRGYYHCQ